MNAISVVASPVTACSCPAIRSGDQVAEVRSAEQAEEQVARQARKTETPEQLAGDEREDQRQSERQAGRARIDGVSGADAAGPEDARDHENDCEQVPQRRSPPATTRASSSENTEPVTTTASSSPAGSAPASPQLSANAAASAPGETRRRESSQAL